MAKTVATPKIEMWDISEITPYNLNVKKHEKEQVTRIAAAISKSGRFDQPIVVDRHGVIIKGHGRRLAAIELGMSKVPVICHRDISPEEAAAMRLADNRVAISDIDTDMLKVELGNLDLDMLDGIFDSKELDFIGADLGTVNPDSFVNDMGEVLVEQKRDIDARSEEAAAARVPLHKVFGFKDIDVKNQIHFTRLMAKAEDATGLTGEEALINYVAAL